MAKQKSNKNETLHIFLSFSYTLMHSWQYKAHALLCAFPVFYASLCKLHFRNVNRLAWFIKWQPVNKNDDLVGSQRQFWRNAFCITLLQATGSRAVFLLSCLSGMSALPESHSFPDAEFFRRGKLSCFTLHHLITSK